MLILNLYIPLRLSKHKQSTDKTSKHIFIKEILSQQYATYHDVRKTLVID